ncbi:MAG TPA: lmo0937 family membrane protein [Burkholderiaceae bacterium]|nr:lmo0937 family membrane protein [Burkholderiaceae bacterium]
MPFEFLILVSQLETIVLYTIALVLVVLWILGFATSFTAGGLLHVLLVLAVGVVVYQLATGRRAS